MFYRDLTDWLIDWSAVCSIDWLFDQLIDWLINWLFDQLIDCLIDWLFDWSIDCLIGWLIDWLVDLKWNLAEWSCQIRLTIGHWKVARLDWRARAGGSSELAHLLWTAAQPCPATKWTPMTTPWHEYTFTCICMQRCVVSTRAGAARSNGWRVFVNWLITQFYTTAKLLIKHQTDAHFRHTCQKKTRKCLWILIFIFPTAVWPLKLSSLIFNR